MSSFLIGPGQESQLASPASSTNKDKDSSDETIITATVVNSSETKNDRSASPSALETFLNNFLREENIKWMSIIGAAIVLASSLMLVTRQWTTWSTELKYLTILAYTFATYYSGSIARTRLGLATSGRVMELLSLLLMPLCFIALGLLDKSAYSGMPLIEKLLLVVPALGLTYYAASRIFNDILRGPQPTFLISYLLMAAAGALPTMSSPVTAGLLVVAAWLVTSIGVIKVNRHIFWLTEETKQPRVFAFLPIALLGSMFLVLVATKALPMIAVHWLGTVCVLFAGTILLTARSAAEVFKQRTGNLVRPLPWSLMAPLVIGLIVIAAGVALSCYGFSFRGPTTIAIIPTSLMAGGLLCIIAWDTSLSGFVWPALTLLTVAYQVSPVLFRTTLMQLRDSAAAAMNESTLPLAFYGITYMPLVGLLIATSAWCLRRKGHSYSHHSCSHLRGEDRSDSFPAADLSVELSHLNHWTTERSANDLPFGSRTGGESNFESNSRWQVFAGPTRYFVTGLMLILFVAALTNLKALAIVATIDAPILLLMAVALRERAYAWFSLACMVLTSLLLFPFGHAMGWWDLAIAEVPTSLAGLGLLLAMLPGLDRLLARIPSTFVPASSATQSTPMPVCITLGYCLAFLAAIVWSVISLLELPVISTHFLVQWILIGTAFLMATIRTRDYLAALGFWSVMAIGCAISAATWTLDFNMWSNTVSIGCAVLTLGLVFVLKHCRQILAVDTWRSIRMNSILLQPIERSHQEFYNSLNRQAGSLSYGQAGSLSNLSETRSVHDDGGWVRLLATLSVALRDLSLAIALCLAAIVLVPASIVFNLGVPSIVPPATIFVMTLWGICMTYLHRSQHGAFALGILTPLCLAAIVLGYLPAYHTLENRALIWTAASALVLLVSSVSSAVWLKLARETSQGWLAAMGLLSLIATDPIFRLIGMTAVAAIVVPRWRDLTRDQLSIATIFVNVQSLLGVLHAAGIIGFCPAWLVNGHWPVACALLIPALAISALLFDSRWFTKDSLVAGMWAITLRVIGVIVALCVAAYHKEMLPWIPVVLAGLSMFAVGEFMKALRLQQQAYVWSGLSIIAAAVLWLVDMSVLELGTGTSQIMLAIASGCGLLMHRLLRDAGQWKVFERPMFQIGMFCPAVLTGLAIYHQVNHTQCGLDPVGMLTMFAAAFVYFHQAYVLKNRLYMLLSIAIVNAALMLTAFNLNLHDVQFYCVPVGLSVIAVVQLLKRELPRESHDPLRYIGALIVLVSPMFHILDGGWMHMLSLLVLCVLVMLLAIGLRLRALLNVSTAFLLADLVMMVVRSSIDNPSLLWINGLGIGAGVILLAAICERHREQVLSRIRLLSAELATWN